MNIPFEIFILAASLAGSAIGALGARLYYRPLLNRKEKETWSRARVFYTRANDKI